VDGHINSLNRRHIEDRSHCGALRARAIVAAYVYDQRVIKFAQVFNRLNDPTNLMVCIRDVSCKDLCLMSKQLLLIGIECIPLRQAIWPRSQLSSGRNDSKPLLVRKDCLAQFVPASVE